MSSRSRLVLLIVAVSGAVSAPAAPALADGYFEGTKGARAAGRAGAFTARADDLSALQLNPAGLGHLRGTLLQVGNRFSSNAHDFERQATLDWGNPQGGVAPLVDFERVDNDASFQLLDPILGAATDFGLADFHFALAAYAPAGIGRERYPVDGGQRYMMVRRDSQVINWTAAAAYAQQELFGVGLSLQWITVPKLEYQLVVDGEYFPARVNPVSSPYDMLVTIDGKDLFTFNMIVGAWYRPAPWLEVAISGQVIPTAMNIDGTLDVVPLNTMIQDAGDVRLLRGADQADDVSLRLPLPITARAAVRYIQREGKRELFDVELDLSYEAWSVVRSFRLDSRGLVAELFGQSFDIGVIEIDKHWRDTLGVALGGDYALLADLLTVRGGVAYHTPLARPQYEHVDFVGAAQIGGALGVSVMLGQLEIALGFEHRRALEVTVSEEDARFYQEVPGSQCEPPYQDPELCHPEALGQPSPAVNAGTFAAVSNNLSLDALYRF